MEGEGDAEETYQRIDEYSENSNEECERADDHVVSESRPCKNVRDEDMDPKISVEGMNTLPEALVERILSMVPFPFVFRARMLSKAWSARLPPIPSKAHNKDPKHLAHPFQTTVSEFSWKVFCPIVYQNGYISTISTLRLYGFNRSSHTWQSLPSLSFFPDLASGSSTVEQIEGTLLLLSNVSSRQHFTDRKRSTQQSRQLYVANLLTRSWKELPSRPCGPVYGKAHLCHLADSYKVIHLPVSPSEQNLVEIYDSRSSAWTVMEVESFNRETQFYGSLSTSVPSKDGIMYISKLDYSLQRRNVPSLRVLALNLNEDTPTQQFDVVAEVIHQRFSNVDGVHMVICKSNLLMVMLHMFHIGEIVLLKLDLESRQWTECAKHPVCYTRGMDLVPPVHSDGDYIFTYTKWDPLLIPVREFVNIMDKDGDRLLAYDVDKDSWILNVPSNVTSDQASVRKGETNILQRVSSSFRPGFNPFVAV